MNRWAMSIRNSTGFTLCSTLLVLVAPVGCRGPDAPDTRQPLGVVLISIDTLRADHLGCYGSQRPTSPFIDQLASRGVRFENAIVQVPGTLPSHMSMLTGLLPVEHDVFPPDGVLSDQIKTLPEILAAAKVRTAGFTEGGYVSERYGFSRGFEQFDDSNRGLNSDVEDVFRHGLGFLESVAPEEQFFLFLHTYAVHDPYIPPPPYTSLYFGDRGTDSSAKFEPIPAGYDLRINSEIRLQQRTKKHNAALKFVSGVVPPGSPMPNGTEMAGFNRGKVGISRDAVQVYEALYDSTINYVDDLLRAFFRHLTDLGLDTRTIVIITSDHGEEFLEHGRLVHEQVFYECVHVPLVVVGPGVAPGEIRDLVMSIDLAPTILEVLGMQPTNTMSGQSLMPALSRPEEHTIEKRDAYSMAFIDPVESLHRIFEQAPFQLIVDDPSLHEKNPWVEREITLHPVRSVVNFDAMSYHVPREVEVSVDDVPLKTLSLTPAWQSLTIELPNDGRRHIVTMSSSKCVSPASLGKSEDARCLAFRLRGFESRGTRLFNLSADPDSTIDLSAHFPERTLDMTNGLGFFHRDPIAKSVQVPLDSETEKRLKALGYLQ